MKIKSTLTDTFSFSYGAPSWIRTNDLRLRSPLLYPAELSGHVEHIIPDKLAYHLPLVLNQTGQLRHETHFEGVYVGL